MSTTRTAHLSFAAGSHVLPLVAVAVALAAPPALAQTGPDAQAAGKGELAYVRYCVACHGKTGLGDGSLAEDLKVPVPDLTTLSARSAGRYPFERVQRIIQNGEPLRGHGTLDMPAWGDAFKRTGGTEARTPQEAIRNLTHFLWSLQGKTSGK